MARARRKIIHIDEEKCNGCGLCVTACAEGAIQIIDGKARLVSEVYCDGLGACLGDCPEGAITLEEREAEDFDTQAVQRHLQSTKEPPPPAKGHACPGAAAMTLKMAGPVTKGNASSALTNWPIQLHLAPLQAPYFHQATLLIAADCVPFAYPDFHHRFLQNRTLLVGCPKLDDGPAYRAKLAQIIGRNEIQALEILYMEVPCCMGLVHLVQLALADSGKSMPVSMVRISLRGEILERS